MEELLGKEVTVRGYSALVAAVARHQVNTPSLAETTPDAFWRAAALLEQIVLLRPLPVRSELFGYGVATGYIEASGESVKAAFESWRDLIMDIQARCLTVYDVADRLRSWRTPTEAD
ncbi:toxin Doc [Streptomyces anulatus]|uniref:toxin Doc n=1 Tax=Streptomyces anulatus TaxID=1892 RepID=UPI00332805D6